MTLAVLLLSALTAGAQITYYATEGTKGNSYTQNGVYIIENYKNLVDGDRSTKWCVTQLGNPTFIEFYASEPITPKGYVLTTGNDTDKNPGRNPKSWTIKAKVNKDDDWTVLTTVTDDEMMPAANTTECPFHSSMASRSSLASLKEFTKCLTAILWFQITAMPHMRTS